VAAEGVAQPVRYGVETGYERHRCTPLPSRCSKENNRWLVDRCGGISALSGHVTLFALWAQVCEAQENSEK